MKTLFFDPSGPLVQYSPEGMLHVADLNPEVKTKWRMSRWELFAFGWRCLVAAARQAPEPRVVDEPATAWTITSRNNIRERLIWAWMLLFKWPRSGAR